MVSSDYRKWLKSANSLDDFVGGRAVTDQVTQKNVIVDPLFLGKLEEGKQGFEVAVNVGEEQIAHFKRLFP